MVAQGWGSTSPFQNQPVQWNFHDVPVFRRISGHVSSVRSVRPLVCLNVWSGVGCCLFGYVAARSRFLDQPARNDLDEVGVSELRTWRTITVGPTRQRELSAAGVQLTECARRLFARCEARETSADYARASTAVCFGTRLWFAYGIQRDSLQAGSTRARRLLHRKGATTLYSVRGSADRRVVVLCDGAHGDLLVRARSLALNSQHLLPHVLGYALGVAGTERNGGGAGELDALSAHLPGRFGR